MEKPSSPLSEPLRRAIVESGIPYLQIQEKTGIERSSISRFVTGKRSLRLDLADKLAAYFGLILKPGREELRRKGTP
jgi:plasmid maintenance system antidote protein VapI